MTLAAMLATYIVLQWSRAGEWLKRLAEYFADRMIVSERTGFVVLCGIATLCVGISLLHYFVFDGFTLLRVLASRDSLDAAMIRQNTGNIPGWMNYLKAFAMSALFPVGLLLATMLRKRFLIAAFLFFGMLYAVNLLQKSGPIVIVLPTVLYLVGARRYVRAVILSAGVVCVVVSLGFVANPGIQPAFMRNAFRATMPASISRTTPEAGRDAKRAERKVKNVQPPQVRDGLSRLSGGLFNRVVIVPGNVVGLWTNLIPSEIPYGRGCGYRFLAPLLGCEFQNYSLIVYDKKYPEYTSVGIHGSVNAASMMVGFANFGPWGVIPYGILQGIMAIVLYRVFRRDPLLILPVNATYIFFLSSSDLLTTLLSGGWALAVLMFVTMGRSPPGARVPAQGKA
jgi:hypothetical protein